MTNSLGAAAEAVAEGRFRDAQGLLVGTRVSGIEQSVTRDALLAFVADQLGDSRTAFSLAQRVYTSESAPLAARATACAVMGRLDFQGRRFTSAVDWFHRAIRAAQELADVSGEAEYRMLLLDLLGEVYGLESIPTLIRDIRTSAMKSGSAQVLAGLHLRLARIEGRYGSLDTARYHVARARALLSRQPNYKLSAIAASHSCVVALLDADFDLAVSEGKEALRLTDISGFAHARQSTLVNLSHGLIQAGDFRSAEHYLRVALRESEELSRIGLGVRDSYALFLMATGRFEEAGAQLERIVRVLVSSEVRGSWQELAVLHSWIRFLLLTGQVLNG